MNRHFTRVLVSAILAVVMAVSAFAAFTETNTYTDGMFTDVQAKNWFAKDVASAYKLGLMNGMSATTFSPNGNVTVVQGIIMAARANAIINERPAPENSKTGKWYDNYVNYAIEHGIIKEGQFDNYNRNIKRWEMAELFYDAMPAGYYTKQNNVVSIPDVDASAPYAEKILALYNAGIVMGSDDWGTFNPESDIKRSESAAIINRVAIPANRLKKSLKVKPVNEAYVLNTNDIFSAKRDYINSGWVYDNRGGAARNTAAGVYSLINDISTEYGTALIREFNEILGGAITIDTSAEILGNGAYLEFRNSSDKPVYQLKLVDNAWKILGANGQYTTVMANAYSGKQTNYTFKITVDLDTGKSTTYVNGKNLGSHNLLATDSILNFRFATDEAHKDVTIMPAYTTIHANYAMYETFETFGVDSVYGWTVTGDAKVTRGDNGGSGPMELYLTGNSSVNKKFVQSVNGKFAAETYFYIPDGQNASFAVNAGTAVAVKIEAKDGKFYANGTEVSEASNKIWHRLRIEGNTATGKADILINGRKRITVDLLTKAAIDNATITNASGTGKFDNIRVYKLVDHADYVPEPIVKEDDYIIGMNVCSIWRNGQHYGWATISPYDEPKPVLGYYDEGVPETADWEIKYMVDHGVDYQAFCWYPSSGNVHGAPKNPGSADFHHLHDGYMYAKYSNYMNYALILEFGGISETYINTDSFKEYYIPYFFENYFLDKDRYLIIDNKPVLYLYGVYGGGYEKCFGGDEGVKAILDYIEEVAKSYGYDGMYYIASASPEGRLGVWGVDAAGPYNYTTNGGDVEWTKSRMTGSATAVKGVYMVPTLSTGFDNMPWHGTRYPNMSVADWTKGHEWIRDVYIPAYKSYAPWSKNMVLLSVWNEFGEGTYINPAGLNGFGYLDAVRDVYTKREKNHEDPIPTDAQAQRIQHLYPQYQSLLKRQGYYVGEVNLDDYKSLGVYKITKNGTIVNKVSGAEFKGGITGMTQTGSLVELKDEIDVAAAEVGAISINIKVPKGTKFLVEFLMNDETAFNGGSSFAVTSTSDEMTTYTFATNHRNWLGTLKRLAVVPAQVPDVEFQIESLELFQQTKTAEFRINDAKLDSIILPKILDNGDALIGYDPQIGITYMLNSLSTWRRFEGKGVLTIEANHHKAVFTVGSDKYTVDGKQMDLGYELYLEDGIPMISYTKLAEALGYEISVFNGIYNIKTPQYDTFVEKLNKVVEGEWNFDFGSTEGWSSEAMNIQPTGSSIILTSISDTNDDPVTFITGLSIDLSKYRALRYGCVGYDYESANKDHHNANTCYYNTTGQVSKDYKTLCSYRLPTKVSEDYVEIEMEFLDADYTDVIMRTLRFDPFNAHGTMEIDYIKLVPINE